MLVHQLSGAYVDLLVKKGSDWPDLDKNKVERGSPWKLINNMIIFEILFNEIDVNWEEHSVEK